MSEFTNGEETFGNEKMCHIFVFYLDLKQGSVSNGLNHWQHVGGGSSDCVHACLRVRVGKRMLWCAHCRLNMCILLCVLCL